MSEGVAVADPSTTIALSSSCNLKEEGAGMVRLSLPLHHQVRGDAGMALFETVKAETPSARVLQTRTAAQGSARSASTSADARGATASTGATSAEWRIQRSSRRVKRRQRLHRMCGLNVRNARDMHCTGAAALQGF